MSPALAALLVAAVETSSASLWWGHQVTHGERALPLLGPQKTRTDTWVLAELVERDGALEITERPCRVRFAPVAGVQVSLSDEAVRHLPVVRTRYLPDDVGYHAGPWPSGWDARDHDGDGHPGVTILVDAPLCGGRLYVATEVESIGRARRAEGALVGELRVRLRQRILGADGTCLEVLSRATEERLRGTFRYVPAPPGARCEALEEPAP